jgi:hypothetical protein
LASSGVTGELGLIGKTQDFLEEPADVESLEELAAAAASLAKTKQSVLNIASTWALIFAFSSAESESGSTGASAGAGNVTGAGTWTEAGTGAGAGIEAGTGTGAEAGTEADAEAEAGARLPEGVPEPLVKFKGKDFIPSISVGKPAGILDSSYNVIKVLANIIAKAPKKISLEVTSRVKSKSNSFKKGIFWSIELKKGIWFTNCLLKEIIFNSSLYQHRYKDLPVIPTGKYIVIYLRNLFIKADINFFNFIIKKSKGNILACKGMLINLFPLGLHFIFSLFTREKKPE